MADETDNLTRARGRRWLSFWHGALGLELDRALVRFVGWSPVYTLFAHRGATPLQGVPIVLRTRGRVSGQWHSVVLPAFRHEDTWVVCATAAGGPRDPHWVKNIEASPGVIVRLRRRRRAAEARVLTGEERDRAESAIAAVHASLPIYQRRADRFGRRIPLVALAVS